jgi:hypothetical protein
MQILSRTAWAGGAWSPDGTSIAFSDAAPDTNLADEPTFIAPQPGHVQTGFLEDGTPFITVAHDDGAVTVVEAISPHLGTGNVRKMLGWCPSTRSFDDPVHGSRFDEYGRYISGPSPSGLVTFATAPVHAQPGSFTIGEEQAAIPRDETADHLEGPFCTEAATELTRPSSVDLAAADPRAADTPASLIAIEPVPPFGSRWEIEGSLLLRPDGTTFLCDRIVHRECLDGVPVEGPALDGGEPLVIDGRWSVLIGDGVFVDPIWIW